MSVKVPCSPVGSRPKFLCVRPQRGQRGALHALSTPRRSNSSSQRLRSLLNLPATRQVPLSFQIRTASNPYLVLSVDDRDFSKFDEDRALLCPLDVFNCPLRCAQSSVISAYQYTQLWISGSAFSVFRVSFLAAVVAAAKLLHNEGVSCTCFRKLVPLQALSCTVIFRSLTAELSFILSQGCLRTWRVSCRTLRATPRLLGSTSRQLLGSGQQHAPCRSACRRLQQHLHCADSTSSAGHSHGSKASKPGEDVLAAAIYAHGVALHCLQLRREV